MMKITAYGIELAMCDCMLVTQVIYTLCLHILDYQIILHIFFYRSIYISSLTQNIVLHF